MKNHLLVALLSAALMASAPAMAGDDKDKNKGGAAATSGEYNRDKDKDVTYGKVKEFKAGQEITIHVPNAMDKSYDLSKQDKEEQVVVPAGLKVGDEVAVRETEHDGKKMVKIEKHPGALAKAEGHRDIRTDTTGTYGPPATGAGGAAATGGQADKDRARAEGDKDVTYGQIKEYKEGQAIKIHVPKALDKSYDLSKRDQDEQVMVAAGLKVGDEVGIRETKHEGKKMIHIEAAPGKLKAEDKRNFGERNVRTDEPEKK